MDLKKMKSKINIAVVFGGQSNEHLVSLASARGVIENLDKNKYNLTFIAITKNGQWLVDSVAEKYLNQPDLSLKDDTLFSLNGNLCQTLQEKKIDLVLPILHGSYGEDGKLQGMLEMFNIPYAFSDVLAHALAMDKYKAKIMAQSENIPIALDFIFNKNDNINLDGIIKKFDLPIVIKPLESGSSVWISIAKNKKELAEWITKASLHSNKIMLEKFITGRELTVPVIENNNEKKALSIIEIIPKLGEFYDYNSKYSQDGSTHICPAQISPRIEEQVKDLAIKAFDCIGCHDIARIDFIWSEENETIYFLEINTIPGMTPTSLTPESAKTSGIYFPQLLDIIINNALQRNN